jgi:hypothetical protein
MTDREKFERLALKLREVCREAMDDGIPANMLLGALGAALSFVVMSISPRSDHEVENTLNDMVRKIMADSAHERKKAEDSLQ